MSEQYRLRVVPDPLPPPPSQIIGLLGCWFAVIAFGIGFYVAVAFFIRWVLQR